MIGKRKSSSLYNKHTQIAQRESELQVHTRRVLSDNRINDVLCVANDELMQVSLWRRHQQQ